MAPFDPKIYRNNKDGIGGPGDDAATDSTSAWTVVALLKGIWAKLNGTLSVSFSASGIATAAKQDTGNASLGSIDTKATAANASLASMDGKLTSLNFNTDTLEIAIGITAETAPASDTATSGLNGRLQRVAQRLTSLIALLPSSIGAKTAAGSISVTTATDDNTLALLGAVNETAPASDTASSGLNGRQQRIAQRLTSLIALLPASIGVKLTATSLSATIATDDVVLGATNETAPASDTATSGHNGRLQRIAQRISSLIALVPASLGAKTAAASFAVTLATDDVIIAPIGAVNETAPASDTASSGLNGRLQRVAQRITSLIALVPASLGAKTASASFAVTLATDDAIIGGTADAAATAGSTGSLSAKLRAISRDIVANIVLAAGANLIGRAVADASAATGGISTTARLASAAASTNATLVKASAGRIYQVSGKNNALYDVFLVLYDATTNPPVPGTTTIRKKIVCPAGQAFVYEWPVGLTFATGIGYAFTKLVADADTTVLVAADITAFNLDYV